MEGVVYTYRLSMKRHQQPVYRSRSTISFACSTALLGALASSGPGASAADVFPQLPVNGALPSGVTQATMLPGDSLMKLTQTTKTSLINWESFSIGAGKEVQFNFDQVGSAAINRVVGSLPSNIAGTLSSVQAGVAGAGTVVLINPNGLVMTSTARINVGSFIGSAFDISQSQQTADEIFSDYFSGKAETLKLSPGTGDASKQTIEVQGDAGARASITAAGGAAEGTMPSGSVILVARKIVHNGDINAGSASLAAAAEEVELHDLSKVGLGEWAVKVKLPTQTSADAGQPSLSMDGTIAAVKTELQSTGGDVFALAMNRGSSVGTPKFAVVNGEVVIRSGGTAKVDGTIATGAAGSPGLALKTQAAKLQMGPDGHVAVTGDVSVNGVADGVAAEAALGNVEAGTVHVSADVAVLQNGSIKSAGDQIYNGKFQVAGAQEVISTAGNVAFNSTVDGTTAHADSLAVSASDGGGAVLFREEVGSAVPLASLSSKGTTIVRAASITADTQNYQGSLIVAVGDKVLPDGSAHLNGDVKVDGDLISRRVNANGNVVLTGDLEDIEGGDNIVISKAATLGGKQEDTVSGFTRVDVKGTTILKAGTVTAPFQVYEKDLILAGGNKTLAGNVDAQGNVLSRRINANGNIVMVGEPDDIEGGDNLLITKNANLGGKQEDAVSGLSNLEVQGQTILRAGSVKAGNQFYRKDLIVAGGEKTLAGNVTADANVLSRRVNANGNVVLAGDPQDLDGGDNLVVTKNANLGSKQEDIVSGFAAIEVQGKTLLKAGSVNVANQAYKKGLIVAGGDKTLDGNVSVGGDLVSRRVNANGNVELVGDLEDIEGGDRLTITRNATLGVTSADDVNGFAGIEVGKDTTLNAASVSAGIQNYKGKLTVSGGAKVLTGNVTTQGGLAGANATDSVKIIGNAVIGDDAGAGDVSNLAKLEVTKTTTLKAASVTAAQQIYTGKMTVGGAGDTKVHTLSAADSLVLGEVSGSGQNSLQLVTGAKAAQMNGLVDNFDVLAQKVTQAGADLEVDSAKLGSAKTFAMQTDGGALKFKGNFDHAESTLALRGKISLDAATAGASVKAKTLAFDVPATPNHDSLTQARFVDGANFTFAKYDLTTDPLNAGGNTLFADVSLRKAVSDQVVADLLPKLQAESGSEGHYASYTLKRFVDPVVPVDPAKPTGPLPTETPSRIVGYSASIRPEASGVAPQTIVPTTLLPGGLNGFQATSRSFDPIPQE